MSRKYFGTDGIRGRANTYPMTADVALKVAMATARVMKRDGNGQSHNRVVIGKDTRLSCYMLEQALTSGFLAMGMDVVLTGPIPTPAIAMLTRSLRADVGVMISASHNKFEDNGIKLFGHDGFKLADAIEIEIENWIDNPALTTIDLPEPAQVGRAARMDDAVGRYVEFVKSSFPRGQNLSGLKIVVDCANGAAYKVAPQALWELEAEVIAIGVTPNGKNINQDCGATSTETLQRKVIEEKADLGIALDGDADRLMMVDEKGKRIDGDQLLCLLANRLDQSGSLEKQAVVATVMSNLGMERYLKSRNIDLIRTSVGDRYVVEKMKEGGYSLGGEQSGHIVLSHFGTTGDGLLAALQILSIIKEQGKKASEVLRVFDPVPQVLKNVRFEIGAKPLEQKIIQDAIQEAETTLSGSGRLLVRPSGTEPLIRVMAEGDNADMVKNIVDNLCAVIGKA
ncbi:MAG: phosphoglucosamine mutase [Alphaproteobacteria bacterium]|jgi:phosphoglucosamine mutase|nr:phosphoglucosamine mutase [Alphaproteobacteria bacterium]MCB1551833.1 phosphoglucosamine mutase [Alphaproteobacteria bacterium]MCB9984271.1 phosphoglucosamine mutase [Micavibrio sp.]HRK97115.1 phosphoglucosamine mutase [Alphaproteobacteria bacterium]